MACYYDILGVPRDADEAQISKSYRTLALRWHPDKNLDDIEGSTITFQEIQKAYSVLSDQKKRQLYDDDDNSHNHPNYYRFNFPRKCDPNDPFKYIKCHDLRKLFYMKWFNDYSDRIDGFYTMSRKLFEKLTLEVQEQSAFLCLNLTFGSSNSNYRKVILPFYLFWSKAFPQACELFQYELEERAKFRYACIIHLVNVIKSLDRRIEKHLALNRNLHEIGDDYSDVDYKDDENYNFLKHL